MTSLAAIALPVVGAAILLANLQRLPFAAELIATPRSFAREWWAVPLFFALYVLFAMLLLPVGLLSAAAALAWGWKAGGAIELIACTVAAMVPFELARGTFASRVEQYLRRRGIDALSERRDFFPLLLLRILPAVPYVALNYLAGLARFRRRDYLAATFFGSIPSVFLFQWFIHTAGEGQPLKVIGACAAVAAVAIIVRRLSRGRATPPPAGGDRRSASTAPPPG
ncbi:MAG TPA: VTT domain-containing protein [Thermoanaerobaculia bacterium]|nr:VTT domain-containing protein [Thermoanaerobaculia bacterium]